MQAKQTVVILPKSQIRNSKFEIRNPKSTIFRYVLQVFDMPKDDLAQLVTQTVKPDVKEFLMTTYEQLRQEGEQKGRLEGRLEGEQKGASLVVSRLLFKRFPGDADQLAPLLHQLNPEQQAELAERILEAHSPDEIREWLDSLRHN